MIHVHLLDADNTLYIGHEELLDRYTDECFIWIDLDNEPTPSEDALLTRFDCHPLAIEDARRTRHPPKLQVFHDHIFLLLRGLDADSKGLDCGTLQIGLFASQRFLITRHVKRSVSINIWRQSAELAEALKKGGLSLALEIAGTAAERYLHLLLEFEPQLDIIEDQLMTSPNDNSLRQLTLYKTSLRKLRRTFNYHARVFESLTKEDLSNFTIERETLELTTQSSFEKYERLYSLCGMFYELAGDLIDGYISISSHELNNTMRVLTVLTAIFVPLSFLVGLYGMNFDYMPELHWRGSYFILLSVMAGIIVTLLTIFRRKRWL